MSQRSGEPSARESFSDDPDVDRLLRIVAILKAERLAKGFTLRQLSRVMGIDFTHLSRSERGLTQPGVVILMRWCRALDLEIESLFRKTRR